MNTLIDTLPSLDVSQLVQTDSLYISKSGDPYKTSPIGFVTGSTGNSLISPQAVISAASTNLIPSNPNDGSNVRYLEASGGLQWYNSTTQAWHTLVASGNPVQLYWIPQGISVYTGGTYYISILTGNTNNFGSGTILNPWNGITATGFEKAMTSVPPYSKIILGTGTFKTSGVLFGSIRIKSGWNISGAGIDLTTVQLINTYSGIQDKNIALSCDASRGDSAAYCTDSTLQNFTVDCNIYNQTSSTGICCMGIFQIGNHVTTQNVKIVNWGSRNSTFECFPLYVGGSERVYAQNFTGAKIINCQVISGDTGAFGMATLITLGVYGFDLLTGDFQGYQVSGLVSGCLADATTYNQNTNGFTVYGKGSLAIDNVSKNAWAAVYADTHRYQDVTIKNNILSGCNVGIFNVFTNGVGNVGTGRFLNNNIYVRTTTTTDHPSTWGMGTVMYTINPSGAYTIEYLMFSGNVVSYTGFTGALPSSPNPALMTIMGVNWNNVKSGDILDNVFSGLFTNSDPRSLRNYIYTGDGVTIGGAGITAGKCQAMTVRGNTAISVVATGLNINSP